MSVAEPAHTVLQICQQVSKILFRIDANYTNNMAPKHNLHIKFAHGVAQSQPDHLQMDSGKSLA